MGARILLHTFTEMNLICGVSTRHTFARKQLSQLARPLRSQIDSKPSINNIADLSSRPVAECDEGKGGKIHLGGDAYVNRQGTRHIERNESDRGLWQWLCTWSLKHRHQTIGDPCWFVNSPNSCDTGRVTVKGGEGKRRS
eukprot:GHVS01030533.1.p2 GENE.GHVS01030533.1~~GHVS01030533.1.p2  ORF type:complete len:140 (+),score=6.47 GHVS01030533.1:261-680(+)